MIALLTEVIWIADVKEVGATDAIAVKATSDNLLGPDESAVHGGEAVLVEDTTFNVTASINVVESPGKTYKHKKTMS